MKGIETGKEKVRKICEALRKETLEPAILEAENIVASAKEEASRIIAQAQKEVEGLFSESQQKIEREREIFQIALNQASKQAVQFLKQMIEEKLFNKELSHLLSKPLQNPQVLAEFISAIVKALSKDGSEADLSVFIPATIPARDVNALLAKDITDRLKEKSVLLAPIAGGIEVKLRKQNITLDLSDEALKELLANYIRKDFRELFFGSS